MGLIKNQNKRLYPQTIIIFKRNFLKALIVGKSATGKLSFWSCKKQLLKTDTRVMIYLIATSKIAVTLDNCSQNRSTRSMSPKRVGQARLILELAIFSLCSMASMSLSNRFSTSYWKVRKQRITSRLKISIHTLLVIVRYSFTTNVKVWVVKVGKAMQRGEIM